MARKAFEEFERQSLETRYKVLAAMRAVTLKHVRELATYAVDAYAKDCKLQH